MAELVVADPVPAPSIRFDNLGPVEYERAKKVFDRAKHPGFIGRELVFRAATKGIVCVAVIDGVDSGIAIVVADKLCALSVIVTAQGRGVGPALMTRLRPRWVSAIDERVGFFEKLGYARFGAPKVGQNGKHATQLMQRGDLPMEETAIGPAKETAPEKPREPSPAEKAAREMMATTPLVTQLLTADESKSPLFRSLRDIDRIEDPDARLAAALDRLDSISKMALGRERTVGKDQHVILDPDCNAAVKVEEVAHRLLAIEPRKLLPKAPQLGVFDRPLQAVK